LNDESDEYTLLKLNDKITVYSNKLGSPITTLDKGSFILNNYFM